MTLDCGHAGGFVAAPGDDLCLDFVNTRSWRGMPEPIETLQQAADVVTWARTKGGLDKTVIAGWDIEPGGEATALTLALTLRETLFRVFAAAAADAAPAPDDFRFINECLAAAARRTELVHRDGRFLWAVSALGPNVAELLSPVLWSATDLLAGPRIGRVRLCGNPQCLWLFLDDSKSGNRRWCSMASCGNRAKAHRHYLKRREAKAGE